MLKRKILVVVLALDAEPWRTIQERGQRGTWAAAPDVPVLWLHGRTSGIPRFLARAAPKALPASLRQDFHQAAGRWAASRKVSRIGDRIETEVPETYIMTNAKTIAAFRHILQIEDFDYVLRTNSSTYVNLSSLENYVQGIPRAGFYGGTTWRKDGLDYVTGTSILLSRDLVEHVAHDRGWEYKYIDDVALGRSMQRAGVKPIPIPRVDACTEETLASLTPEQLSSTFIVRCRGAVDRAHDISAMRQVHELYAELEGRYGSK